MRTRIFARFAVAIAAALFAIGPAHAQLDAAPPPPDPDPAAGWGFSWLCPVAAVATVGGLYIAVRRRQREAEADRERGIRPEPVWYCRHCLRDVSGSECPQCHAPNPFTHEPAEWVRTGRASSADSARLRRVGHREHASHRHVDDES